MPLIPLHDGLFTVEPHEQLLRQIMEEELVKAIGRRPTLRREEWSGKNLSADKINSSGGATEIPQIKIVVPTSKPTRLGI